MISEKHTWDILKNYFDTHGFVEHQTRSFDEYINIGIPRVLKEEPDIVVPFDDTNYRISFNNVYIPSATVLEEDRTLRHPTPAECRQRDLTYDAPIYADIIETNETTGDSIINRRVVIGRTPIMLRSSRCNLYNCTPNERIEKGECEWDQGGYFIIRGKERVLIAQQRALYNKVLVFLHKDKKIEYKAEMRSMSDETGHSVSISANLLADGNITFNMPYVNNKEGITAGIVFKALGFITEKDITDLIDLNVEETKPFIVRILRNSYHIETQEEALRYIGRFAKHVIKESERVDYARQVIEGELFPHMGVTSTIQEKGYMLGYMINKLLRTHLKHRCEDDRDNYKNKRIETAGILCYDLFRTLYKRLISTVTLKLEKKKQKPDVMSVINKENGITSGLKTSFSISNWGAQKNSYVRTGVSQILSRLTYGATLSHLRRIMLQIGKEAKNSKIRQINPSQIMFLCPSETPEGQSVGIVLNLSLLTQITERTPINLVKDVIENMDEIDGVISGQTKIFLNGVLIGSTSTPKECVENIKELRRFDVIPRTVSVSYDPVDQEINMYSDEGRLIRPIFTTENGKLLISEEDGTDWDSLVDKNLITYVDNSEIDNAVIAFNQKELQNYRCDYCEISAAMMLGVMASIIPFPDHSQSPRNCYQSSMGKQAMGMFNLAHLLRADTIVHVLDYPQKPLVSTKPSEIMGFNNMASGINCIVAIAAYTGFNQEDSVIMNRSAIERGLFQATTYKCHTEENEKKGNHIFKKIGIPPLDKHQKEANYGKLDETGVVKVGTIVVCGDIIIGKVSVESDKNGEEKIVDCSLIIKKGCEGQVDRIYDTIKPDGYRIVKIIIRTSRTPEVGDKFASRAAQKGTMGMYFTQENMPFNSEGISPDIIINPHCIPSRMTINQLMECVLGKSCCIDGEFGDCTPFEENSTTVANEICDKLQKNGYERHGNEVLYNGLTGEKMEAAIFMGPTYYQRLKHLASDKIHARARGQVTTLTRQPREGRQRDGGLRFGEMERDCMIGHGNSRFLKERLFDQSDPYRVVICDKCGNFASSQKECRACETDMVTRINMPYSSKLVLQELNAMGIKTVFQAK